MNARNPLLLGWIGFGIAYLGISFSAHAEPTSADKSLATQLFKEGRTLVDQGKYPEACRKLEESQRLDPGGGTLLNLALCHEKEGRSATAWTEFTEALGIARRDDRPQRVEIAQQHIEALEPTLSRLIVQVPLGSDLPDLEIKRDSTSIRRAAWGTAMPVDPGDHVVEVFALGKIPWNQPVTVGGRAEVKTVTVPRLENAPIVEKPATSRGSSGQMPGTFVEVRRPANPAAWVAYGIGAVGVGVGAYFGVRALGEQRTADDNCPLDQCTLAGSAANTNAIKYANLATAGFGVGVVGVGLGTFLLLLRGTTTVQSAVHRPQWFAPRAVAVDVNGQQLSVSGAW